MRKQLPPRIKIVIQDHVIKRYVTRTGKMSEEHFKALADQAKRGDKKARKIIDGYRRTLKRKFRKTYLHKFLEDGCEIRREWKSSMNERCTFIALKRDNTFYIKTVFLQGKKRDFWKKQII